MCLPLRVCLLISTRSDRFDLELGLPVNMDLINECRSYFDFMLTSELLVKRKSNFLRKFNSCSSVVCHFGFAKCVKCV